MDQFLKAPQNTQWPEPPTAAQKGLPQGAEGEHPLPFLETVLHHPAEGGHGFWQPPHPGWLSRSSIPQLIVDGV